MVHLHHAAVPGLQSPPKDALKLFPFPTQRPRDVTLVRPGPQPWEGTPFSHSLGHRAAAPSSLEGTLRPHGLWPDLEGTWQGE